MDIQYVLDAYARVMYVLVHNEDREINGCVGVLLKQVADELKTQLRKIGSAFLGKGSQCPGSSVQVALIACETIE